MTKYNLLFKPIKIGSTQFKNRMIMPAMDTSLGDSNGYVTDDVIAYYEERAEGGVGGIIVEYSSIEGNYGRQLPNQLRIDEDSYIEGMSRLAKTIKKHNVVPILQLHHAGRVSEVTPDGELPKAPSPIPPRRIDAPPQELTIEEIEDLVQRFVDGARRAIEAGFQGVEIHGAHIYLIHQFLSPKLNVRNDKYGGSVKNRARFLLEIITAIRQEYGEDFPIWVRLNGEDFEPDGITVQDTIETVKMCEECGATAIHISGGAENWRQPMAVAPIGYPQGLLVNLAETMKKHVQIPVISVGKIKNATLAEQILQENKADMVAIGRALIADPYWPQKVKAEEEEYITPCIGCNECLTNILFRGKQIICSTNPRTGYEEKLKNTNLVGKKVLVVGGGVSGLTSAVHAAQSGAEVTVVEKDSELGGILLVADIAPHKEDLTPLNKYLITMVEKLNITVRLNTLITQEIIQNIQPDAVIIATGAKPSTPKLSGIEKGLESEFVVVAEDVLSGKKNVGEKVFILGGELTACETGEFLAEKGHEVMIGRRGTRFATKIEPVQRKLILKRLEELGATFVGGIEKYSISNDEIIINKDNTVEKRRVDNIILATGYNPTGQEVKWIEELVPYSITIGDAREAGDILNCVHEARSAIDSIYDYSKEKLVN